MLTLATGGRSLVVLAAGYRQAEFDYYDVVLNQRAAIIEETVEVLQRAWTGESFAYQGRRIELVSPVPEPAPRIVLGGASPLMARMVAPLNLGFAPGSDEIYQIYRAECLAHGHTDPGPRPIDGPHFLFLSEDPDKAWSEIGGHILENAQMYAGFLPGTHTGANVNVPEVTLESLQQSASHAIVTPDQCITLLKDKEKGGEVWVANLNPNRQREIGKIRLVLVFQANELTAANSPTIVILPTSTRVYPDFEHWRVTVPAHDRLLKDCQVLVDQPRALDRSSLGEGPLTMLNQQEMTTVEKSFLAVVGIL